MMLCDVDTRELKPIPNIPFINSLTRLIAMYSSANIKNGRHCFMSLEPQNWNFKK